MTPRAPAVWSGSASIACRHSASRAARQLGEVHGVLDAERLVALPGSAAWQSKCQRSEFSHLGQVGHRLPLCPVVPTSDASEREHAHGGGVGVWAVSTSDLGERDGECDGFGRQRSSARGRGRSRGTLLAVLVARRQVVAVDAERRIGWPWRRSEQPRPPRQRGRPSTAHRPTGGRPSRVLLPLRRPRFRRG